MGRNFSFVLLLVINGALFWPTEATAEDERLDEREAKSNRLQPETYH